MKLDESKKGKAPLPKKVPPPKVDEKKGPGDEPDRDLGPFAKLKWPNLKAREAIGFPLAVLLIALLITGFTWLTVGSPLHLGLDFKGGTTTTIKTDKSDAQLNAEFAGYPLSLITRDPSGSATLRFSDMDSTHSRALTSYLNQTYPGSSLAITGSAISATNAFQAVIAIVAAFVLMALVIFVIFRDFVPSIAVITSAFSDIMIAMALMNIFHIELTFGTFAALLMLIGYSVDTDILLTTKVLGERKYLDKKIASCRATGLTMTGAALAAFGVLFLISNFAYLVGLSNIPVLASISTVMIFGLLADIINTWFLNSGLLKWYMESPQGRAKYG